MVNALKLPAVEDGWNVDRGTVGHEDALFSALDADHNYRITASELDAVLGPQGDGMPSAADRIRNLDRNGDGELNDEEMRNAAETRFQWLDKNQDGKLDLSELKSGFGVPLSRP